MNEQESNEGLKPGRAQTAGSVALTRQLRAFQILTAILAVALLCGGAYYVYKGRQSTPVAILVAGKSVAVVDSLSRAQQVLTRARLQLAGASYATSAEPRYVEQIELKHLAGDATLNSDDDAIRLICAATRVTVEADAIVINGKPVAALPDKETAQAAIDAVRAHYAQMPPDLPLVERPSFEEKVEIVRDRYPTSLTLGDADSATRLLQTPPRAKTYVVTPHETGWSIAKKFHLSFTDFLRANTGSDVNHLAPGDTVNVSQSYPALTVIVKKEEKKDEPIIAGAPASVAGLREMDLELTFINGIQSGPPGALGFTTIQKAEPRREL